MNIQEIYDNYRIPPWLQDHMYRVAAVAYQICKEYEKAWNSIGLHAIVAACLLHDMWNIIKFTFDKPIPWLYDDPEYRIDVQEAFIATYGTDEHLATILITKEVTSNTRIHELVNSTWFTKAHLYIDETVPVWKQICCYADQRVAPYGIVSLKQRTEEAYQRYKHNPKYAKDDSWTWQRWFDALVSIETSLFNQITLEPSDITSESSVQIIESLKQFSIQE